MNIEMHCPCGGWLKVSSLHDDWRQEVTNFRDAHRACLDACREPVDMDDYNSMQRALAHFQERCRALEVEKEGAAAQLALVQGFLMDARDRCDAVKGELNAVLSKPALSPGELDIMADCVGLLRANDHTVKAKQLERMVMRMTPAPSNG